MASWNRHPVFITPHHVTVFTVCGWKALLEWGRTRAFLRRFTPHLERHDFSCMHSNDVTFLRNDTQVHMSPIRSGIEGSYTIGHARCSFHQSEPQNHLHLPCKMRGSSKQRAEHIISCQAEDLWDEPGRQMTENKKLISSYESSGYLSRTDCRGLVGPFEAWAALSPAPPRYPGPQPQICFVDISKKWTFSSYQVRGNFTATLFSKEVACLPAGMCSS